MNEYQIAFVGNPNVGKSAWINTLSDADFKVGNWPGVTVEKKEALVTWHGERYHLIDLPGTYSLSYQGNEEDITAHYLMHQRVDLIVNVVDATNLSRNLYLTLRLRQLQKPMILIFNFMDEVKRYHMDIDVKSIEQHLQIPIYPYSAFDEDGKKAVKRGICDQVKQSVYYSPCIAAKDQVLFMQMKSCLRKRVPSFITMTSQEQEQLAYDILFQKPQAMRQCCSWDVHLDDFACYREEEEDAYLFREAESLMEFVNDDGTRFQRTRKLDAVLLHPLWGMIALAAMLSLLMLIVFQSSAPFNDWIDFLIHDMVMKYVDAALFFLPAASRSLVLDGVIAGVGGVLVFIPLMFFLHIALSCLEESGYMARIAYLLDHFMRQFHLNGKSFVSLLLGFGCNVPAIYATRALSNEKQKKLTALLVPFMSCGARLPVYMLFAAAFFPHKAALAVLSIYGIGILIALIMALVLSKTADLYDDEILVMELPPYRVPMPRVIFHKAYYEVKNYVRKATSVVLWAMVILWGLTYFPNGSIQDSYLAQTAKTIAPIYEPLGFGSRWESVAALPGSIVAKETVVGFMDQVLLQTNDDALMPVDPFEDMKQIVYEFAHACREFSVSFLPHGIGEPPRAGLVSAIGKLWDDDLRGARAYAYMVYILLSIPCIMTLQAMRKEYGWKLMGVSLGIMIVIPYATSWMIFQILSLVL